MTNQSGQTLLELVVVVSVSVIIISALVFATTASLRNAQFSKNQALATKYAQEGIERIRSGRDRNQCINGMTSVTPPVNSWAGNSTYANCSGTGSIWNYRISGDCDKSDLATPTFCYFNIDSGGALTSIGFAQPTIPSLAEGIPTANPVFKRVITLSDDLNHDKIFNSSDDWQNQKEVTVIVTWTDFSGYHESRLTTILRRI